MAECPTPRKASYTENQAKVAAARIRADDRGPDLTPYPCVCDMWHLTSGGSLEARMRAAIGKKP